MHVVFRADASRMIGSGHVMRCLALAEALRGRGVSTAFVCRTYDGNLCDLIEARGVRVMRLPAFVAAEGDPEALDGAWQSDADATRRAVECSGGGARASWLVVDHYGLDARFERAVRPAADRIFAIDDMANRDHDCDVLLDQNVVANAATRYDGRTAAETELLIGPDYALLQPAYAAHRRQLAPRDGAVRRILVYFGGADREDLTARVVDAIQSLGRQDIAVDVVTGATSPAATAFRERVAGWPNVTLHGGLPHLADLMARADLAIGAGGSATWERLCLGLPTIAVILAENQRPIVEALAASGAVRSLGTVHDVSRDVIRDAVADVVEHGISPEWAHACRNVVDGLGAGRVAAALGAAPDGPVRARMARASDEALVLEWVNDAVTRANAFSTAPIGAAEHHRWFSARLAERDACHYYLAERRECPIGQVRFQRDEDAWELHYALAPAFRGQRLAAPMLAIALQRLRQDIGRARVFGRVKSSNRPSHRVFETLGFTSRESDAPGVTTYERVA